MPESLGKLAQGFIQSLESKEARIGVIGLGYVGLPLAREMLERGLAVTGFDIDPRKIEALGRGESYIDAVPSEALAPFLKSGQFKATCDYDAIVEVDAVTICVPTPLTENREPDVSYIVGTAKEIAMRLRRGQLVVLESTTYPGTTDELLRPLLEEGSRLRVGRDFFLAYSPERENPGDDKWRTRDIPKVVGADDADSRAAAEALYSQVVNQVVPVSSSRAAESSKLLENIYRCVNIALVNELKVLFERMDIDLFEVIEASKTKPFGFKAFYPGPGLGGHCIPIDPFYLSWKAREFDMQTRFIELAGEINRAMPRYVVERCLLALNDDAKSLRGARVLVLGVAYKENVDDIRESPALFLIDELSRLGADVNYHDPHVPSLGRSRRYDHSGRASVELSPERLAAQDLVLVVTAHAAVDYALVAAHSKLIVDTRNALAGQSCSGRVVRA